MTGVLTSWAASDRVREVALSSAPARDLVSRYVAGRELDELIEVIHGERRKGLAVSVEYLANPVSGPSDAAANLQGYLALVDRLAAEHLAAGTEISIRLGWLGQELNTEGRAQALEAGQRICRAASNAGAVVTLGMTTHDLVADTLASWRQLQADLPSTGITVQAALHRTAHDLPELAMPANRVRLCKGAHTESRKVAFRNSHEIDLAFVRGLRMLIRSQAVPLVATHDPRLIAITEELLQRSGRGPESYEFQMNYGIRPLEQRRLVDIGLPIRVRVPFGPGWYEYYLRRLAERPASAALFARSLFGKR